MLELWANEITLSDRLVNGVIDSADAPPSPKSVAGPSTLPTLPLTTGTVGNDLQTQWQAPEPSDSGYAAFLRSSPTVTRPNAPRYPSGLSTPSMAGRSVSTISSSSIATTEYLPASPFDRDADGNPIITTSPQSTGYPCIFSFMDCDVTEPCKSNWLTHNLSHFRTNPPPPTAVCPFCRRVFNNPQPGTPYDDGSMTTAWDQYMECFASHIEGGATLDRPIKDVEFFRYLWRKKVIKANDFRDLVQDGKIGRGGPLMTFEQRQRGSGSGRRQQC
jgi:hypothetical protein